jgi:hypothetical protein
MKYEPQAGDQEYREQRDWFSLFQKLQDELAFASYKACDGETEQECIKEYQAGVDLALGNFNQEELKRIIRDLNSTAAGMRRDAVIVTQYLKTKFGLDATP